MVGRGSDEWWGRVGKLYLPFELFRVHSYKSTKCQLYHTVGNFVGIIFHGLRSSDDFVVYIFVAYLSNHLVI